MAVFTKKSYNIVSFIGQGSFSSVFKVKNEDGSSSALKILKNYKKNEDWFNQT